jgi:RNA polymerase-binding transcription factor DksA
MLEALGAKDVNKLKLIDSALSRIEQNKYGLCIKCGKKIPQERLEAIPSALLCVECKTEDERKNR